MLVGSAAILAQSVVSGLRGTVTDPNGAVVAGAQVTLTEPSTGSAKTVVTDSSGNYEFAELKPGTYKITVTGQGFSTYQADEVLIENLQTRRVDVSLKVGSEAESVTVNAGAAVITTEGGTISSNFSKLRVADNPTTDTYPSPYSLFTTLPGVQGNGWDLKVSGQNASQQTIGLDGVINDRYGEQNNNINFYDEATITTVNATADNARVVNYNLVSKRGENKFHGMAYYKRFDSVFDARDFFEPQKTTRFEHEAQGEISGPIWKNKTFFYFSWFYQRVPTGTFFTAQVPNTKWRTGDFSDLLGHPDPNDDTVIYNPFTGNPFPGNKIPVNMLSQVALKLQNYFPTPNSDIPGNANFSWIHPFADDYFKANFPFIRVDHNFTKNNSLNAKWTRRKTPYVLGDNVPDLFWTRLRNHGQFSATDTQIFASNLINSFTFGWSHDRIEDGLPTAGQKPVVGSQVISETGLQGTNPGGFTGVGFPSISFSSVTNLNTVSGGIRANDDTLSYEDSVTWTKGRHVLKFGGEVNTFKAFSGVIPNYGSLTFDGSFSGFDYADFLLGLPITSSRVSPRVNRTRNNKEMGFYGTDSFKVNQRLTVDFGLRWDYYGLPRYKDGLEYNFDPSTGTLIIPTGTRSEVDPAYPGAITIVEGNPIPKADLKNFRPRVSAAYRFGEDFILRGGYGQFTERFSRFYFDLALGGGPFSKFAETYTNSINDSGQPLFQLPNPFPASQDGRSFPGAQSVSGFPLQNNDGTIHQYNISLEKEINGLGLRASYIGSRGVGLRAFVPINERTPSATGATNPRPYPQYRTISYLRNDFGSKFDSMQFEVQRRRGDFTFDAHYTYSLTRSNLYYEPRTGTTLPASPDPYNPTSQWAVDSGTRKHLFVATSQWSLPLGKGRRYLSNMPGVVDAILGGWRIQTISYIGSGQYFTPYICGQSQAKYGTYGGGCIRPDVSGDPNFSRSQRSVEQWYNSSAFSIPTSGTYGNAKADSLEGPGLHVHHISLAKTFSWNERYKLTYTWSVANIFNTPNFGNPSGDIHCVLNNPDDYCGAALGYTLGVGGGAPENGGHRSMYMKLRFEF
jgi:hypothetical protein